MFILLTIIHVVVCIFLIIVVLLQSGKAADLAGAFGGMGSQTAFGPRGSATLLSKATTISAVVFMITSLSLSILATRTGGTSQPSTVLDKTPVSQSAPAKPAQPAPAAPAPAKPGQPVPVQLGKPGTALPGQPSVTFERDGKKTTVPLQLPPQPAQPAPAKKK